MVPDRAQSCRQAAHVVFFRLSFLQVHHVNDGGQFLWLICFRFSHQPLVFKAEGILRQQLKRLENCAYRGDCRLTMKSQLIAIVAAVLVVGCGESQPPELPTVKAPDTSIHDAAVDGHIEIVKQHIAAGTDVNAKFSKQGWTPLNMGAWFGHKEIVELLLANGAGVNIKNNEGKTPLYFAAQMGHKEIVELLIAKGANLNAKAENGFTPLDRAFQNKHPETADLLRKHGGKTAAELKAEGK